MSNKHRKLTHVDLEITRKCNLKCIHCSAASKDRGREMSVQTIKRILADAKAMGLEKVGLTGGEPFLNKPKLMSLANFCRNEESIPIHIHSNGTVISKENAKWVKQIDAEITIPFYSSEATIHESITNVNGSFSSTLNGLKNLVKANADVCVYVVPMKQNRGTIQALVKMVHDEGIRRIRVLSLSPTGRAKAQFEKLELIERDTKKLNEELIAASKEYNMEITTGFCTSQNFTGLDMLQGHEQCFAAENRIHIDTFGNVFPCTASSGRLFFSAGNLQTPENSLRTIWSAAPLLQFFRNFHANPPKKCTLCDKHSTCMSGCRVRMSFKYGDITIANPTCKGPYKRKYSESNKVKSEAG